VDVLADPLPVGPAVCGVNWVPMESVDGIRMPG